MYNLKNPYRFVLTNVFIILWSAHRLAATVQAIRL